MRLRRYSPLPVFQISESVPLVRNRCRGLGRSVYGNGKYTVLVGWLLNRSRINLHRHSHSGAEWTMDITSHNSQHEYAEALPVINESASVTEVASMDHNRVNEILSAVTLLLSAEPAVPDHVLNEQADGPEPGWLDRFEFEVDSGTFDWSALSDTPDAISDPIREEVETLVARYQRAYPALLRVRIDEDLDFSPGQYVTLRYEQTPRPYSIASSPADQQLELCIRRVPHGTLTQDLFEELSSGETVSIRGPTGDFLLEDLSDRDMVFLATGTGVAPLKSMIEYTFEAGQDRYDGGQRDLWLFLGSSWEDDLPYRERFRELDDQYDNFHFVPTLSRESYLSGWDGETAYVQQTLMKYIDEERVSEMEMDLDETIASYLTETPAYDVESRLDPDHMDVYACGINAMVFPLVSTVHNLGVPEQRINSEGYG